MKLFPVVALALVGAIGQISNAEYSITLTGSMTVDDLRSKLGEDAESSSESASASMSGSASGSMELETLDDLKLYWINQIKTWSDSETQTMIDWAGASSEEFKEFEKELEELVLPVVTLLKNLPDVNSSVYAFEPIMAAFQQKTEQFATNVNSIIEKISSDLAVPGSMNLFEYLKIETGGSTSEAGSGSDTTSTEGSDESSIMQKSVDSTTQSSPSFQKTWDKLTGSAPSDQVNDERHQFVN